MSAILEGSGVGDAGATGGAEAGAPAGAVPDSTLPAADAAEGVPTGGEADASAAGQGDDDDLSGLTPAERAMARVKARETAEAEGQETGKPGTPDAASGEGEKTGEAVGQATDDGDGATVPDLNHPLIQALPPAEQAAISSLAPESQQAVLNVANKLQSVVTKATDALRDKLQSFETEQQKHGDLVTLAGQFDSDPKAVIGELAKRANIPVFFDRPSGESEIPTEFESTADQVKFLTKWLGDEMSLQFSKMTTAQKEVAQQDAEKLAQQAEVDRIKSEFRDAHGRYSDFGSHQSAVVEALSQRPNLSVEEAYRLVAFDGLTAQLQEMSSLRTQVESLTATKQALESEVRKAKARTTRTPQPRSSTEASTDPASSGSQAQDAFNRVLKRTAAHS